MFATIIISLIAILFAFLARYKKFSYGLEVAFLILTVFIAIRYNWGNDYTSYLNEFLFIGSISGFDPSISRSEIGWTLLNYIFQPIGFFGMTIILTSFEYFVIYRLIKKYVPVEWYWFSIFIFTFNSTFMLVCASMMRQFFSMCIFIIAIEYIIKKRWIISIILIFSASLFHTSALILLPFSFFGYLNINLTKTKPFIWFGIYLILYFVAVELLGNYFRLLLNLEPFEGYQVYLGVEKISNGSGLGLLFNMIILFTLLIKQQYQNKEIGLLFIFLTFADLISVFNNFAPMISRLGFYFSILSLVCYPFLFITIKKNIWKYVLMFGYMFLIIRNFFIFFDPSGIWFDKTYIYQTIFSTSSWM